MSDHSGVARKSVFVFSYNILGGIVGYITMFFALRLVGQTAWGVLGSALAISGLLGIIANLGTTTTHIKKLTQKNDFEECMGSLVILKSFLGFLFLLISFLLFFVLGDVFGFKFESVYLRDASYIAIFGVLIGSFSTIFQATYQAKMHAQRAILPMFVQLFIQDTLIIVFSLWYFSTRNIPPEYVGVLYVYSFLLSQLGKLFVLSIWAIKDKISFKMPSKSLLMDYIIFSIPLALSGIVGTIQAYTDRAMLQFFWNTAEVGGYFTIQKLALFITYLGASVSFFLYPIQSHYYEKNRRSEFYEVTRKSERYLSLISVPFVFFTFVMAPEILNIYKSSLISYSLPLTILMAYAYLNVINRPYGSQITSANRPKEVLKVGVIQATLNVVLNSIFIPSSILGVTLFGLKSTGAALATFLSFLFGFVYFRLKLRKILKVKFEKRIVLHIFSGSVAALVILLIKRASLPLTPWYTVVGAFILFLGIYGLILVLFKEISKKDIEMARSILISIFKR